MSDSSLPLKEQNIETGKYVSIDTEYLGTVAGPGSGATRRLERMRFVLGGSTLASVAAVTNTDPGVSDYGLVVRIAGTVSVSGGGSGTQYADGASRGTATGTLMMVDDGTLIQAASGDSSGRLNVNALQSGTWTVQPGNTANTTPWLFSIHDGSTKATVRDLAANDALNVAIVDASGNQIVTFGGLTYAEDAASAGGESLTMAGVIRQDTLSSSTSNDGDYATLKVNSAGALYVVTGAATNGGATAKTFDFDSGAGTDTVTAFGIAVAASGGSVAITGDVTNGLDVDVTRVPTDPFGANADAASATGSISAKLRFIAATGIPVTSLPNTTNAGATAKTSDYDSGAGTDTVTMFGIALPASGGAVQGGTSTNPFRTDPTGTTTQPVQLQTHPALTASSPTNASVGTSSAQAVASNGSRKGLVLINLSNSWIYLGIGATAVVNSGISIAPNGGTWMMTKDTFVTGAINAIADAASSTMAVQEFT